MRESLLSARCDLTRDVCGSLVVVLVLEVIPHRRGEILHVEPSRCPSLPVELEHVIAHPLYNGVITLY